MGGDNQAKARWQHHLTLGVQREVVQVPRRSTKRGTVWRDMAGQRSFKLAWMLFKTRDRFVW
jgi:hypothetical protein